MADLGLFFFLGGVGVGGGWGELMNRSIQNGKSPDRLACHFSIFKFGPLSKKDMFAIMNSKEDLFVNHILLMAKKCIYSSRCNRIRPSLQYYIR